MTALIVTWFLCGLTLLGSAVIGGIGGLYYRRFGSEVEDRLLIAHEVVGVVWLACGFVLLGVSAA